MALIRWKDIRFMDHFGSGINIRNDSFCSVLYCRVFLSFLKLGFESLIKIPTSLLACSFFRQFLGRKANYFIFSTMWAFRKCSVWYFFAITFINLLFCERAFWKVKLMVVKKKWKWKWLGEESLEERRSILLDSSTGLVLNFLTLLFFTFSRW